MSSKLSADSDVNETGGFFLRLWRELSAPKFVAWTIAFCMFAAFCVAPTIHDYVGQYLEERARAAILAKLRRCEWVKDGSRMSFFPTGMVQFKRGIHVEPRFYGIDEGNDTSSLNAGVIRIWISTNESGGEGRQRLRIDMLAHDKFAITVIDSGNGYGSELGGTWYRW